MEWTLLYCSQTLAQSEMLLTLMKPPELALLHMTTVLSNLRIKEQHAALSG